MISENKKSTHKFVRAKIAISVLVSFVLICVDYFFQNNKYPWFDNLMTLSLIEYVTGSKDRITFDDDSVFCVNVAHDKALASYVDKYLVCRGNDVITSRDSLLKFLNLAAKSQCKYIFLDVRFSKRHQTEVDSALFATILSIPNIVVSNHCEDDEYELADKKLKPATALADYGVTLTTGFSRYEFLQDGEASVALKMYRDIDHGDIVKWHNLYFDKSTNHLCFNAPFIPIPRTLNRYKGENTVRYPYLGAQLFGYYTEKDLIDTMKGRYVLVGDFDEDLHGTYVGDVPGPMLSFLSYKFIKDGKHLFPLSLFLMTFVIYSVICWFILRNADIDYRKFMNWLRMRIKRMKWQWLAPLLLLLLYPVDWIAQILRFIADIIYRLLQLVCKLLSIFRPLINFVRNIMHWLDKKYYKAPEFIKTIRRFFKRRYKFIKESRQFFIVQVGIELLKLILALIGWSGIIFAIAFLSYILFDVAILSVLPTFAIAAISYIVSRINIRNYSYEKIS